MPYFEVEKYQVFKFGGLGLENASAIIQASGEGHSANLVFVKENNKMPQHKPDTVYFREKEFPSVMDLLRNERPVHLNTEGVFFLFTEQEGVGDHELVQQKVESLKELING